MPPKFIHLRCHSEFSLIDGIVKIKPLVKRLAELQMPALAVTDHVNLFALVKFYKAATAQGIKPIAGADVLLANPDEPTAPHRLTLLVANQRGYVTLTELISQAYRQGQQQGVPLLRREWLEANHDGLLALSGGMAGDIGRALLAENHEAAQRLAAYWQALFPQRFYLELQRVGKPDEERYIAAAVDLAIATDLPVVATNDVRFLYAKDYLAHEVRVCINQGRVIDDPRRPQDYTDQQYLRSAEEMQVLFADIPEALENTVEIAKRCNITLTLGKNFLPDYPVPDGMTIGEVMGDMARAGLEARLSHAPAVGTGTPEENRKVYDERLDFELNMITRMGFPGYFMIVADFIQWAKNHGIPVGPGRGSGAGSLVAYCLKITDLDPIEFDLLFERFLNPERVSMPDFDIDFCMDRRDEVIDYVAEHYGRDHVAQIITYGSMAAKAVIRDVGRVLGFGYGFVDKLAKLVPFEVGMTLSKALQDSPELKQQYDSEEEVKTLIDMALSLEGTARNAGKHAGGVVIAPTKLTDFTPLYCEEDGSNLVTQFDKDDVEAVGLVKFDFLGLRTLTIIDWALQTINAQQKVLGKPPVDISLIPRDDAEAYTLLKNGLTTAVFQLESRGMKELIKKLQPDCFDDIIALVALFRPGPLESGMVDDYINVKHQRQKAEYAHPLLEPILQPTNGVILYQEQVMQIAREMALYTLGGADMLRRAMGKKKPEEMAKERDKFVSGALENQVEEPVSTYVFDLMEKFAGYGFNKTVHRFTKVSTITGDKNIEDCRAGDVVFSMNADGSIEQSTVIALHDHGQVPLWLVEFNDGTKERCTLDHKWLTDNGQVPLWQILRMDYQVWGTSATFARHFNAPETMPNLHESDSLWTECGQRDGDVLRGSDENPQKSTGAFSNLRDLSGKTPRNSGANLQRFGTHRADARKIFTNREENIPACRCAAATRPATEELARGKSRRVCRYSQQSSCFAQTLENGKLARTAFNRKRFYSQCAFTLWYRKNFQASRFYVQRTKNRYRNRWTLAFLTRAFGRTIADCAGTRPHVESRNNDASVAVDSFIDAMFQRQIGRAEITQSDRAIRENSRHQLARGLVFRQPVRATFVGWHQGYDLEVAHPQHNFLLASGLCCSNSHSAAYALVAYQTAWLKTHYPAAFMAAVLSADMDNTEKVVILIEECQQMKIVVLPPTLNASQYKFTVNEKSQLIYGLGAIKGVGEAAIEEMIKERLANGAFSGLYDLCKRLDTRKFNRRVLEALCKAGAFDEFDNNRAAHFHELNTALRIAEQYSKMAAAGQNDLFGLNAASDEIEINAEDAYANTVLPWTDSEQLAAEKSVLGLFLSGHPLNVYQDELKHFIHHTINSLPSLLERGKGKVALRIAGLVMDCRTNYDRQGKTMALVIIDDKTGRLDCLVYSEVYERYRTVLHEDNVLIVEGAVSLNSYSGVLRLTADKFYGVEQAREFFAKNLQLNWLSSEQHSKNLALIKQLQDVLLPFCGGRCAVTIRYCSAQARGLVQLGEQWRVHPSDALIAQLRLLLGKENVSVIYNQ